MDDTGELTPAEQRAEALLGWGGVAVETIGAVLCCVGVIAGNSSQLLAHILIAVGAPLIIFGTLMLWWSTR